MSRLRDHYITYNGPIELSDGDNTIHVKAISSVGYETEAQSHEYKLDLDDKFVKLADPVLTEAIKVALNKTRPGEKLRQSDLDKVTSIQILGDALLINMPVEDLSALEPGISNLSYLDLSGTRMTDVSIFSKANQLKVLKLPGVSQLLNTSVFDDAKDISIVPINISESELATDLLDDYQENLRIK